MNETKDKKEKPILNLKKPYVALGDAEGKMTFIQDGHLFTASGFYIKEQSSTEKEVFCCDYCDKTFDTVDERERHRNNVHIILKKENKK